MSKWLASQSTELFTALFRTRKAPRSASAKTMPKAENESAGWISRRFAAVASVLFTAGLVSGCSIFWPASVKMQPGQKRPERYGEPKYFGGSTGGSHSNY
jgi:hypothetical protein